MSGVVHLRNGRAARRPHVLGDGVTWCGKKLLGSPIREEALVATFSSYGSEVSVSLDLNAGTCPACRERFDAAYNEAFPDGLKPIATFDLNDSTDMERARKALSPEALNKAFGVGGRGVDELLDALDVPQ